jgi:hypothetical protein
MTVRLRIVACLIVLVATLWYLRDPSWLAGQTTGLAVPEQARDGSRFRWSSGHASFFVPAQAGSIRIPIATTFDRSEDSAMIVRFTVDDVRTTRVLLTDARWQTVTLPLPPAGSRKFRRIDIRTNVTRPDNHGVMIGQIETVPRP